MSKSAVALASLLVALAVTVVGLGVLVVPDGSDDDGSLPPELSSAIRRSLRADRIHMESPQVVEDFVAPDRYAVEYSIEQIFREIIIGRMAYATDLVGGSGYVSCALPPPSRARSASRARLFLAALQRGTLLEIRDGDAGTRYRVRLSVGTEREGTPSNDEVVVALDDGFVRSIGTSIIITYGTATVEAPSADQTRMVADCNDAIPAAPLRPGQADDGES